MPSADPTAVLEASDVLAVVGFSTRPYKAAHGIPRMLMERGFTVVPVNPNAEQILGRPAYPTLADVPHAIDLVIVFRPSAEAAGVAAQAVQVGAKGVWLQLGIRSAEAEAIAADAGIDFVQDRCSGVDVAAAGIRKTA